MFNKIMPSIMMPAEIREGTFVLGHKKEFILLCNNSRYDNNDMVDLIHGHDKVKKELYSLGLYRGNMDNLFTSMKDCIRPISDGYWFFFLEA